MKYSKVEGQTNLVRDEQTGAILNTNVTEYQNYINLKKQKEKESEKITKLENDLYNLKTDINEIKSLLKNLSNGSR